MLAAPRPPGSAPRRSVSREHARPARAAVSSSGRPRWARCWRHSARHSLRRAAHVASRVCVEQMACPGNTAMAVDSDGDGVRCRQSAVIARSHIPDMVSPARHDDEPRTAREIQEENPVAGKQSGSARPQRALPGRPPLSTGGWPGASGGMAGTRAASSRGLEGVSEAAPGSCHLHRGWGFARSVSLLFALVVASEARRRMNGVEGWGRHLRCGSRAATQAVQRAHPPIEPGEFPKPHRRAGTPHPRPAAVARLECPLPAQ
jgi:hypothetical protein